MQLGPPHQEQRAVAHQLLLGAEDGAQGLVVAEDHPLRIGDPHPLLHPLDRRAQGLHLEERLVPLLGDRARPGIGGLTQEPALAHRVALAGQGRDEGDQRGDQPDRSAHRPPGEQSRRDAGGDGREEGAEGEEDESAGFGSIGHASLSGLASL